ncbi:MAG: aspartate/tyrosine/aromatic aminotransferase [Burkholderiales bacterium]|jgi:aromatic-amino-acid transaminase|nr:aspartate/tyrosine/aromatic aminotransferase [Burkholderiales bacterium]
MSSFPFFADVAMAPRDPILGLNDAFQADTHSHKINLSIGVYCDDNGKVPVLSCVRQAIAALMENPSPRTYLPQDGMPAYKQAVQELLLGKDHEVIAAKRGATIQSLGGTGGLKIGADFLRWFSPNAKVWVSAPTWDNHKAIFGDAGLSVVNYPYYDNVTGGYDINAMLGALKTAQKGDVIVLHACCHNPTGVDPSNEDWVRIVDLIERQNLVPFLDIAYQGFGFGLAEDSFAVRQFAARKMPVFIASSFSKSFSLYGERVGALTVLTGSSDDAARVQSQIKRIIRANYSNPPTFGAAIVAKVLTDPALRALWEKELGDMRGRIQKMRVALHRRLSQLNPSTNYDYIVNQKGMFSYSGLTAAQVKKIRETQSIYVVESGRICVAGLNDKNVETFADAMVAVQKAGA